VNGNRIYGIGHDVAPSSNDHEEFFYRLGIRWDLYKQLGYPEVNTLEDYIPLFEQMVALQPTSETGGKTYAMSLFPDWDGNMVMYVKSTGAIYGYDEFGLGLYDTKTQTYEGCLETGGMYIRATRFYNKLYQKGLLNPDSMTQTLSDVSEDFQNGAALFSLFTFTGITAFNTQKHTDIGQGMYTLAPKDAKVLTYGLNVNGGSRVWTIGSRTPYPELCMAIINWLYTPEGRMSLIYGPKGLTWDYDEDGYPYFTELGKAAQKDGDTIIPPSGSSWTDGANRINNTTWALDAVNPDSGVRFNKSYWPSEMAEEQPDIFKDWQEHTGYKTQDEYLEGNGYISIKIPTPYAATPMSAEMEIIWNQVKIAINDGTWKAICAGSDAECDQIIADMIKQANDYGYQECHEYMLNEARIQKELEDDAVGK